MGIIVKQSFQNLVITYLGFAFGAVNTLFLYPRMVPDKYYGLVTFILASGALVMPLLAFGAHQTLIRFYSSYREADRDRFLSLVIVLPILGIVPVVGGVFLFQEPLANVISGVNPMVKDYLWYGVGVGLAMAYFELFYAWCRVQLQSVFGNFIKEVFGRVGVSVLLLLLYHELIALDSFFKALVGLYVLRTLVIKVYAYRLRFPKFSIRFPSNTRKVLGYSVLMLLGGWTALVVLEVDKVMLNQFIGIENIAYYGVAVYIAAVITVPSRAMQQIVYPLTAELLNTGQPSALERLYKKTSLALFIASGLLFLLIVLNLEELYRLLPEAYRQGFTIVLLIGLARVFDALLGNTNAILYMSNTYKTMLVLGIGFAALTVGLNALFIPKWGLEGAALAVFTAVVGFNLAKLVFVKVRFGFLPFTQATCKVGVVLAVLALLFSFVSFPFHPVLNIGIQSTLIAALYGGVLYWFRISEDVLGLLSKSLRRKHTQK